MIGDHDGDSTAGADVSGNAVNSTHAKRSLNFTGVIPQMHRDTGHI
jgi:hypothetical protein